MNDWPQFKEVLKQIAQVQPDLFAQSLLIGGAAAMAYRELLTIYHDADFPPPELHDGQYLGSKDVDFTHVWKEDFIQAFPQWQITSPQGATYLEVNGIRLGFAQVGVTFAPDEAFIDARRLEIDEAPSIIITVLDPLRLYREKQAMVQRGRGKPNDEFHQRIAANYARVELIEAYAKHQNAPLGGHLIVAHRLSQHFLALTPELLSESLKKRLEPYAASLPSELRKLIAK